MNLLGLDISSSAVKCAVLANAKIKGPVVVSSFETRYDGVRAEVDADDVLGAVAGAIRDIGQAAKKVESIAVSVMAPAWCAMDRDGNALTPIVTHQDRRSVEIARELEQRIGGKQKHLKLAGNRAFPGGISSTTWAWFLKHEAGVMKKADLCGHLNTLLHRVMTHSRVTDPSNASFMGFYSTLDQSGWSDELIENVGIKRHRLPQVVGAEAVGGFITREAARQFGLTQGTPMLAGCVDGSTAVLLAGNRPGTLVNFSDATDALALVTDDPRPHENLLTRAVGVDDQWVSVSTLAAAGSALDWAHQTFFADLSADEFRKRLAAMARQEGKKPARALPQFENFLAGSRTTVGQREATLAGLTLSTGREEILTAIVESLARDSASRLDLLQQVNSVKIDRTVTLAGSGRPEVHRLLTRDWPGKWQFRVEQEATLRGLARMVPS